MKILETDAVLDVPPEVRLCPYCGGKLYARFSMWTQENDGSWITEGVELECESEPELDERSFESDEDGEWDEWFATHSDMPYVYWLPACQAVELWVNARYRFNVN